MPDDNLDPRVSLALLRTEWALERTQLSWVRFTFSLLSTAFALDKGTAALSEAKVLDGPGWVAATHWGGMGLAMVASLMLAVTTMHYVTRANELVRQFPGVDSRPVSRPALAVSILIISLGVVVSALIALWG